MLIANALQLRPPDAAPVLICLNYDARAKFEVAQPIHCHLRAFLLLMRYELTIRCDLEL